jgi:hypothetical protein
MTYKLPIKRLRKNLKAKLPKEVEELYPSSLAAMVQAKVHHKKSSLYHSNTIPNTKFERIKSHKENPFEI